MFHVLVFTHSARTWCKTAPDVGIETRSHLFPAYLLAASSYLEYLGDNVKCFSNRLDVRIRSKIDRPIHQAAACYEYSRKSGIDGDFNVRVALVVFQLYVVARFMLPYQVRFKHKCFNFRIRDNIFQIFNMLDKCPCLWRLVLPGLEILAHPFFKGPRFTHIYYGIGLVLHQIDAGRVRYSGDIRRHLSTSSLYRSKIKYKHKP